MHPSVSTPLEADPMGVASSYATPKWLAFGAGHAAGVGHNHTRLSAALALVALLGTGACEDQGTTTEPAPNRPPIAGAAIVDMTVTVGDTGTIDIAKHFTDPDGDALTFSAASSDVTVVSVGVSDRGDAVVVVGVSRGTATIAVTAHDSGGLSAQMAFSVRVPNQAPTSVGSITGRTLFPSEAATVDLDLYFRDPDRDGLSYKASSSDVAVVTVSLSGSVLRVVGVSRGEAVIGITARDPGELAARASMSVTVKDLTGRWRGAARLTCSRPGKIDSLACYRLPWIFMEFDISLAEIAGSLSGRAIVSWSSSDKDSGRYTPTITIGRRGDFRKVKFVMRYEGDLLEYEGVISPGYS